MRLPAYYVPEATTAVSALSYRQGKLWESGCHQQGASQPGLEFAKRGSFVCLGRHVLMPDISVPSAVRPGERCQVRAGK